MIIDGTIEVFLSNILGAPESLGKSRDYPGGPGARTHGAVFDVRNVHDSTTTS